MNEKITIEGLINEAIETRLLELHTCIPAVVESVKASTVDISIVTKRVMKDGTSISIPVIPDVPVLFFGSGGLSIACQISAGDEGLVIFCERDISRFISDGGVSAPAMLRKHEYSDAIFIPASLSNAARVNIPTSGIEITGDVKINGNISATGEVTAIVDGGSVTLSGHVHTGNQGSPTSPPTSGT